MYRLIPVIFLASCAKIDIKAGVSYFDSDYYSDEVRENPLGVIRVDYETERENEFFCEHISSIPYQGSGDELNHCGFLFKL